MASVRFELDGKALRRVAEKAAWSTLDQRGNRVLNAARRNVSVDTGQLRASLTMERVTSGDSPVVRVGSNVKHARYEEEGTGIYAGRGMIKPKRGQYLRWEGRAFARYSGGKPSRFVFAKQVRGRKGTRFLTRALTAAR